MSAQQNISNIQSAYENNSTSTLDSIQQLTIYQGEILENLTVAVGSDLNNQEIQKIVKQGLAELENIDKMKTSMYRTLTTSYQLTQQQIDAIRPVVASSNVANQLMAEALNVKLKQLGEQIELHNNSERMIGVNDYYARRYEAHSSVMKKIVLFCGIIILVIFLMKIGFISDSISSVLIIATLAVGLIVVGKEVWDISRRNNIDFDKYNYPFNPDNIPAKATSNVIDKKTDETYGRQWVTNICSDITKTAASVENSIAGDVGYLPPDAGSGAGTGSTNANVSSVPVPSSSVTTSMDTSSSMPPSGQETFTLLRSSNIASNNTIYNTQVPPAYTPYNS